MGLWIFATFTSYIIKGLCGFANTMVFTAMLSFGSVNANISPVDLLLGYPANAILTWKNRKSLYPIVSYGTCGKYSWLLPIKKCGCQRHQGGVWSYDHCSWHRDVSAGTPSG